MKLLLTIIIFLASTISYAAEIGCSKVYSSIVLNEKTKDILFEERSDAIVYPASLVKLMTLYLTFEKLEKHEMSLDQSLTISERGEEISRVNKSNSLHLKAGAKITVKEAIEAVIVKSFNEAAVTLAEGVSESEWKFVHMMNIKAQQLGMLNSSFRNASGLHDEGQYTTAYDLARLALALKHDFPQYYHLFALKEFKYRSAKYETHNHVLASYKGAEGMKTGFTNASGFNLICSAKKDDVRVISVVTGCATFQKRDQLTKRLLNNAFTKVTKKNDPEIDVRLVKNFKYEIDNKEYEEDINFLDAEIGN